MGAYGEEGVGASLPPGRSQIEKETVMRRFPRALALLLTAAGALACTGGSTTTPGALNFLTIGSLSPPAGTSLAAGSTVSFSGTVGYLLDNSGAAAISLVIEDQSGVVLNPGNQVTTIVPEGQGSVTLATRFTIPTAGVSLIQLVFTLTPSAPFSTPTTAAASYPVGS
jgi:hypothetical protein